MSADQEHSDIPYWEQGMAIYRAMRMMDELVEHLKTFQSKYGVDWGEAPHLVRPAHPLAELIRPYAEAPLWERIEARSLPEEQEEGSLPPEVDEAVPPTA